MEKPSTKYLQKLMGFPTGPAIATDKPKRQRSKVLNDIYQEDLDRVRRLPQIFTFFDVFKYSEMSTAPNQYTSSLIKRFIRDGLAKELYTPNTTPIHLRKYEVGSTFDEVAFIDETIRNLPDQFSAADLSFLLREYHSPSSSAKLINKDLLTKGRIISKKINSRVIVYTKGTYYE